MRAPLLSVVALTLILGPMVLCGCASTRYERYFTKEDAATTESQGATWKLLYFSQSQRQISALLYVTNQGTEPLIIHRQGADAATFTLVLEGNVRVQSDPPLATLWSPWTGTVERTADELAHQVISPGQSLQISLRWQFPVTTKSFTYSWTVVIAGLTRGTVPLDPVEVIVPKKQ